MKSKMNLIFVPIFAMALVLPMNFTVAQAEVPTIAQEHVKDEVIIGYFDRGSAAENALVRANSRTAVNAIAFEKISSLDTNTEVVKLGNGVSVEAAIARLKNQPGIRFVEPNYIVRPIADSNELSFTNGSLWGMYGTSTTPANSFGSNAGAAWSADSIGSANVVIGVIDEGIQVQHPDLIDNIWINPGEFGGISGFDDDKNGYIDDINGWDFVNNNASVYDGTADDHGTHVAGTIGAKGGNGTGVAGVNWNVKIISTKFLGTNGGTTANAAKALDYLTVLKTRSSNPVNLIATNNSWGGGGFSQTLLDAINRSGDAGMLFVAAAGNSGTNNDLTTNYPSNYSCTTPTRTWDCLIAVAAIDSGGSIASFSSFGARTVDLGAPGVNILSTLPVNNYGSYSGTSMATPHVTGAVALCEAIKPTLSAKDIRNAILNSAASTSSLLSRTVTGGRLDVGAMRSECLKTPQNDLFIVSTPIASSIPPSSNLSVTGGSGDGVVSYSTSTPNCSISNATLSVSVAPISCLVVATKAGSSTLMKATSPQISVSFNAIAQEPLLNITNTNFNIAKGTVGVLITYSGGSGSGAETIATDNTRQCKLSSNKLTVATTISGTVTCNVTVRKAASGYFLSATSQKSFFFK
jgi:subtilisin family serine protease